MKFTESDILKVEKNIGLVIPADIDAVMAMSWQELHDTRSKLRKGADSLLDNAKKSNKDLTAEQERSFEVAMYFLEAVNDEFEERTISGCKNPRSEAEPIHKLTISRSNKTMNENILDYVIRGEQLPENMRALAVGTGTAGGFFLSEPAKAMGLTFQNIGLRGKCRVEKTEQNATTIQMASFMESNWSTNGPFGISIAPTAENATISESDLSAHCISFEVQSLAGLISASRKFYDATVNAGKVIAEAFNTNLSWKLDQQIISGSGIAQFTGLKNCPSAINVNRTTANDVVLADILNMKKSAMPYSNPATNYTWICSPGAFSKILDLEDSGGTNLFIPPAANSPAYKLLGHDIYVSDHCSAVGTRADLILADMSLYQIVEFGNPRLEVSTDAYFTSDKVGVKLVYFADGRSLMRSKITTTAGDFSHIVILQ